MDIAQYQTITGLTVPASKQAFVLAQIGKTQRILESMLGFTLDATLVNENQYVETGKTTFECPCPSDNMTLTDPDPVITAYRLFPYNEKDKYLSIDPATAIHAVKLVKDDVTYRTLDADDYRKQMNRGLVRFLEQIHCWCNCHFGCKQMQLAVDADWVWPDAGNIPADLLDVWAEMTTYYSDQKRSIKAETLGSHRYEKFDKEEPESFDYNQAIIKRYAGPLGSIRLTVTI